MKRELLLNGYRVPAWGNGRALEIGSGAGCSTLCVYLVILNCTLKNG